MTSAKKNDENTTDKEEMTLESRLLEIVIFVVIAIVAVIISMSYYIQTFMYRWIIAGSLILVAALKLLGGNKAPIWFSALLLALLGVGAFLVSFSEDTFGWWGSIALLAVFVLDLGYSAMNISKVKTNKMLLYIGMAADAIAAISIIVGLVNA